MATPTITASTKRQKALSCSKSYSYRGRFEAATLEYELSYVTSKKSTVASTSYSWLFVCFVIWNPFYIYIEMTCRICSIHSFFQRVYMEATLRLDERGGQWGYTPVLFRKKSFRKLCRWSHPKVAKSSTSPPQLSSARTTKPSYQEEELSWATIYCYTVILVFFCKTQFSRRKCTLHTSHLDIYSNMEMVYWTFECYAPYLHLSDSPKIRLLLWLVLPRLSMVSSFSLLVLQNSEKQ